jgi:hypothetical protein
MKTKALANVMILAGLALSAASCIDAECGCAGVAINLVLRDESGAPVLADSVRCEVDGKVEEASLEMLEQSEMMLGGSWAGTYHIWVTRGTQEWESGDIEVSMGGPDDCRLPETQQVVVTFAVDEASSETTLLGSSCGE